MAEMEILRALTGYAWLDKKTGEIHEKLNVNNIAAYITTYRKRWKSHTDRMG
jgi:hypothetical protein